MDPGAIRNAYILYIGAGAVAAGGIISVFRSLPTIWHGMQGGLAITRASKSDAAPVEAAHRSRPADQLRSHRHHRAGRRDRVRESALRRRNGHHHAIAAAILIIVFGFLFVTVSSRLTGEIGSSSNPISGMTVATLLLTCLTFVILGWTGSNYFVTALSIGAIVCIAASNGGTTSQDLKTGFLVGATPRVSADGDSRRRDCFRPRARSDSPQAELRRLGLRSRRHTVKEFQPASVQPGEKADVTKLTRREAHRRHRSPPDRPTAKEYFVWHRRIRAAETPRSTWSTTAERRCISSIAESTAPSASCRTDRKFRSSTRRRRRSCPTSSREYLAASCRGGSCCSAR